MLRELHIAIVEALTKTFPGVEARRHVGEVDVDTIRRHALGRVNMLVTFAASHLDSSSTLESLRANVSVGVFVIAGAVDAQADPGPRDPVAIAEKYTEKVQALAAFNTWGLSEVEPISPNTIQARNLGVGIKANRDSLEANRVSLWVVWWEQSVGLGMPLLVGEQVLPDAELIDGLVEDQLVPEQVPQIGVQEPLTEQDE